MTKQETTPVTTRPELYVVATSHLDTQWRWTFRDTINRYLPLTLSENFARFEEFPSYTFSFEGAFRYMLAKEYDPAGFARLKQYADEGRWHPCGSAVDAGDVNTVSPESLIRQFLYGNGFFKRELGRTSVDVFLPDCFGFGWVLPSAAAHCGIRGFSTSKLEWGSSSGIPFTVGFWEGVDGNGLIAAIHPTQYSIGLKGDLSHDEMWQKRIDQNATAFGRAVDYKYFGLGDTGGAPDRESVQWLETAINGDGPIRVRSVAADQLFRDLDPGTISRLPRHCSELLLIEHGVGTYTSHGEMKRWNRRNELLADAAERAAMIAELTAGIPYPREEFTAAWIRVLANQMHDILPGTSIPEAYHLSQNDELLSLTQFSRQLAHSLAAIGSRMDCSARGIPVMVFNPMAQQVAEVVEATVRFPDGAPRFVRVWGPNGEEVPSQVLSVTEEEVRLLLLASVGPVGTCLYDVRPAAEGWSGESMCKATAASLENGSLKIEVNEDGDVCSIIDKATGREMLASPIRMEFLAHGPKEWPAWTFIHADITAEPMAQLAGPARILVEENGPLRATLRIDRTEGATRVGQRLSLVAVGDASGMLRVDNDVLWASHGAILKVAFPIAQGTAGAQYDLGWGTIHRGNNHPRLYEVPALQWAAVAREDHGGVAVLTDSKYGWDKPDDQTLRLTLLHSPRMVGFECFLGGANYTDYFLEQAELDFGRHHFAFAVLPHRGDWRDGVGQRALTLNQPPIAVQVPAAAGALGRSLSLLSLPDEALNVLALKKSEEGEAYVLRVVERRGEAHSALPIRFSLPLDSATEVNGFEEEVGPLSIRKGVLELDFEPYQIRSIRVAIGKQAAAPTGSFTHLQLVYNLDGISSDDNRQDGDIDGAGHSLPAELLPSVVESLGVPFQIGPTGYRKMNMLVPGGEILDLPEGCSTVHLLACAVGGDTTAAFIVGGEERRLVLHDYVEPIGRWHDRVANGVYTKDVADLKPAYLKDAPVAWVGTHRHDRNSGGNEAYQFCYLFHYRLANNGARKLQLPDSPAIRILAITCSAGGEIAPVLLPASRFV